MRIATDMAEALDYAHRQGVIHRDSKPANVLIHDGQPVISDFGIALAVGLAGGGRLTETGLSLGTPQYMSPEQATGDHGVGPATDIYALGAVLYEMLIGDPPYVGSTAQAILGRIIGGKLPSASEQRASVPSNVDAVIRKALEKLPADRFTSAAEFARALADRGFHQGAPIAPTGRRSAWQAAAFVDAGALLGVAVTAVWSSTRSSPAPQGVMRFAITPLVSAPMDTLGPAQDLAISPDGRLIAYVRQTPEGPLISLRPIDQPDGASLRGSEDGANPFFSPSDDWVGFLDRAGRVIKKVSTQGGSPVSIGTLPGESSRARSEERAGERTMRS